MSHSPLFQKRHYDWLADFAGKTLDEHECKLLGKALNREAVVSATNFKPDLFLKTCAARAAAHGNHW